MPSPYATLDELKDFANKVRAAGGGNPIDALIPAVPEDQNTCLIAKNLNFNCRVLPEGNDWIMWLEGDEITRDKIAKALRLKAINDNDFGTACYGVILPARIGRIAEAFDAWNEVIELGRYDGKGNWEDVYYVDGGNRSALNRLKRFWPYIEASVKEAYANADFVNEKGELVL
jgi:hypothetical protein